VRGYKCDLKNIDWSKDKDLFEDDSSLIYNKNRWGLSYLVGITHDKSSG
jgi:hypothetical protein